MNFNPGSWLKNKDLYKYLAAIPIPAIIILIAVLIPFDNQKIFEPPWLLPVLNTAFVFAIYIAVAYICAKSYLSGGSLSIFLLGCGMLAFGSAALPSGWVIAAPGGINVSVTLFNTGALFGSIFHLMGAIFTSMRVNPELDSKRRKRNLALAYIGILIFIILLTITSLQGITPTFFIQGTGPTLLRQVVVGTSAVLFVISALLFIRLYSRLKEIYLYWYALALMLLAVDLFAILLIHAVGSLINWAARLPLYLGGIYFLNAILIARKTARARGISIEEAVANFFHESEENFKVLVETANDAIVSFNNEGRVLLWNSAAEKIFGYKRSEAFGSILSDLIIPDSYTDAIKKEMENLTVTGKSTQIGKTIEIEAKRKDGKIFPVEFSISARKTSDGWMYTSIIRDITERKRAEEALSESEVKYRTLFNSIDEGFCIIEVLFDENEKPIDYCFIEINPAFERHTGIKNAVGKRIREIVPQHEEHWFEIYGKIALTGEPMRFENRAEQLHRFYDVYAFRVDKPAERKVAVLFKDISERKQAEEALRKAHDELELRVQERTAELKEANKALLESEASYRELTESIDDLFYAMDRELRLDFAC
ncbi:MAG: PAS domain S-box protein [Candidatus Methanoperedens sp.]|nr:PAS domain S-box protein [Candidatus Methanoperedens sp.]